MHGFTTPIALVDEDADHTKTLKAAFEGAGYSCREFPSPLDVYRHVRWKPVLAVVTEWQFTGPISGHELVAKLRLHDKLTIPILVVTRSNSVADVHRALRCGADDCTSKPADLRVLQARLEACLRYQGPSNSAGRITLNDLVLCDNEESAYVGTTRLSLTTTEHRLLTYLAMSPGVVLSRARLHGAVWDRPQRHKDMRVVDTFVGRLRRKLSAAGSELIITTHPGVGYCLRHNSIDERSLDSSGQEAYF